MILLIALLLFVYVLAEPWGAVVLAIACVLEVFEIIFLRRWAKHLDRRTKRTTGAEAMLGQAAVVSSTCRPKGTVRIHGELWDARCAGGADPGDSVTVRSIDGLTLVVDP